MKITTQKSEGFPNLYAFSVSFSEQYGIIGFDWGKRTVNITLWAKNVEK
jgi:phosphopantetheinyl transferase